MTSRDDLVMQALIALGGVASGQDIAEKLGWPKVAGARVVGQVMRFLLPSGQVTRVGDRGVYCIRQRLK